MSNELRNLKRRVSRARTITVTCPASRHVHLMALRIGGAKPHPALFFESKQHFAESMLSVLESLWKARAELARIKGATGAGGE